MDEVAAEAEAKADETHDPRAADSGDSDLQPEQSQYANRDEYRKAKNTWNKRQSRRRQKEQAAAAAAGGAAHHLKPRGDALEVEVDGVKAVCSWDHVQGCWLHGGNIVTPKPRGHAPKVDVDGVKAVCTWDPLQGCWLHPVDCSVHQVSNDHGTAARAAAQAATQERRCAESERINTETWRQMKNADFYRKDDMNATPILIDDESTALLLSQTTLEVDVDGVQMPCSWDLQQGRWVHPTDGSTVYPKPKGRGLVNQGMLEEAYPDSPYPTYSAPCEAEEWSYAQQKVCSRMA